jgi:TetR/AcrR family transcriptional regulator, cholesterol catabolism regulator
MKEKKTNSRKSNIHKKAATLFREKGFSATGMRALAEGVGIEAASLYNHIGSKSELLQDICFDIANQFLEQLTKAEQKNGTITTKLESIIRYQIKMMVEEYDKVYVTNHDWKHLPEPYLTNFYNQRRNYEIRIMNLLQAGIDKKELKKLNPYSAVLTILSAVRGIEFWHRNNKGVSPKELEETMVQLLLTGLKA